MIRSVEKRINGEIADILIFVVVSRRSGRLYEHEAESGCRRRRREGKIRKSMTQEKLNIEILNLLLSKFTATIAATKTSPMASSLKLRHVDLG